MQNRLFSEKTFDGKEPLVSTFTQAFDRYFEVISNEQLLDEQLWRLIERQFDLKWDTQDSGWRGEYWGKLMRGACMVYEHTKSPDLYDTLTRTVNNMLAKADELGRISSYEQPYEYRGWDMWCRKYVMLGMEFYYDICKDEGLRAQIVSSLEAQADYVVKTVGDGQGQIPVCKTSGHWGAINTVSILQAFVKLNKLKPKAEYQAFMDMLMTTESMEGFNIFRCIKDQNLYPYQYPIVKAYEMISCAEGMLDLYRETGKKQFLTDCISFADKILQSDFTLIGGIGCYDETFDNSTAKQVEYSNIHKQETCVTVTLMKFLYTLYLETGKKEYIDAIERSFFNAYLGAYNDQPYYGHLVRPVFYSYSPIFDNPRWNIIGGAKNISCYAGFGCCIAIAAAGLGIIPKINLMGNADGILVNLFMKGSYAHKQSGAVIEINSNYPQEGDVKLEIKKYSGKGLTLTVRYPYWAKGVSVKLNGSPVDYQIKEGYIQLDQSVVEGDKLDFDFDAPVEITHSLAVNDRVDGLFAISKCALVYSVESLKASLDRVYDIAKIDAKKYQLKDNTLVLDYPEEPIVLDEYRSCGKDYYRMPNVSVWLKTARYKREEN